MSRNEKEPGNAIRKWKVNVNESTTSDGNTKHSAQDSLSSKMLFDLISDHGCFIFYDLSLFGIILFNVRARFIFQIYYHIKSLKVKRSYTIFSVFPNQNPNPEDLHLATMMVCKSINRSKAKVLAKTHLPFRLNPTQRKILGCKRQK